MEKKTIVLDASVVVKWYSEEKDSDKALEIRGLYREHILDIIVPELIYYEVINAIRFNSNINTDAKLEISNNLFAIGFDTIVPSQDHYTEALDFAIKKNLTIYDSIYYIIAKDVNGLYITADEEFWKKAKNSTIVLLKKWKYDN